MIQPKHRLHCGLGVLLLFTCGLGAQTVQIVDAEGHSATVTATQMAKAPRITVRVNDHDTPAVLEGASLAAILSLGGIQLGDTLRGPRMSEALLAEASDGYKVVFALAELDPVFATRDIILADTRDGKPLEAKEGPFRIVAPGDKRPARWIRQVTTLRIVTVK
jgi:hypothetical protein